MSESKPRLLCMADLSVSPDTREILSRATVLDDRPPDRKTLLDTISDYDAYFASMHVQFDAEVFAKAQRLRVIVTPSTGLDHIDLDRAREQSVEVLSLRGETKFLDSVTSTAELAWGLMLAAVRKIPASFEDVRSGHWGRDRFRGHQLACKTFGILGCGRLGRIVAEYAKAFRMRVLACDVRPFDAPGIERVDFDALLRESDVISIHIHLTPENTGLISREAFAKMKPGVVLINTSRGAIIDEHALLEALEGGKVSAAGLDVIHGEWRSDLAEHPLVRYAREHDNLVITPHLGGVTHEAQDMTLQFMARKLEGYLRGS